MSKFARSLVATAATAAGVGMAGLGGVTVAHADPIPNWCPGDVWNPSWGNNWDWNACHGTWVATSNNGPTIVQQPPRIVNPGGPGFGGSN